MNTIRHLFLGLLCYIIAASVWADVDLQMKSQQLLRSTAFRLQVESTPQDKTAQKMILAEMQVQLESLKSQGLTREDLAQLLCTEKGTKELNEILVKTKEKDMARSLLGFFLKDRPTTQDSSFAVTATALLLSFEGQELTADSLSS